MIGCNSTDDELDERYQAYVADLEKRISDLEAKHRLIAAHIKACPIGWHNGKPITMRWTTDVEVVQWLQRLDELAGDV